jgi:hypothetical protein
MPKNKNHITRTKNMMYKHIEIIEKTIFILIYEIDFVKTY